MVSFGSCNELQHKRRNNPLPQEAEFERSETFYNEGRIERLGEIEHFPVPDASIDVVLSNCVINLSPDKLQG